MRNDKRRSGLDREPLKDRTHTPASSFNCSTRRQRTNVATLGCRSAPRTRNAADVIGKFCSCVTGSWRRAKRVDPKTPGARRCCVRRSRNRSGLSAARIRRRGRPSLPLPSDAKRIRAATLFELIPKQREDFLAGRAFSGAPFGSCTDTGASRGGFRYGDPIILDFVCQNFSLSKPFFVEPSTSGFEPADEATRFHRSRSTTVKPTRSSARPTRRHARPNDRRE